MAIALVTCPAIGHPYLGQAPRMAYNRLDAGDLSGYGETQIFSVPAGSVILDIMVNITEAFSSSVTLEIGDGTAVDNFMDTTLFAPTATGTKGMKQDAQGRSGGGFYYAATDTIDISLAGATPTAGTAEIYLMYLPRDFMNRNI